MSHCHTGKVGSDCKQNVCCMHGVMTSFVFISVLIMSGEWNVSHSQRIHKIGSYPGALLMTLCQYLENPVAEITINYIQCTSCYV